MSGARLFMPHSLEIAQQQQQHLEVHHDLLQHHQKALAQHKASDQEILEFSITPPRQIDSLLAF